MSESTEDQIIPESLCSPLEISNVCKTSNNKILGSKLESELFYFPPIAAKLSQLGIKSKSGIIAPFVETRKRAKAKKRDPITGEEIKTLIRFYVDSEYHKIIPTKTKPGHLVIDKVNL